MEPTLKTKNLGKADKNINLFDGEERPPHWGSTPTETFHKRSESTHQHLIVLTVQGRQTQYHILPSTGQKTTN